MDEGGEMTIPRKTILAALVGASLLTGCASYYDDSAYGYDYDRYGYAYGDPTFYNPAYVGPSIGLGLGYQDYEGRREWHGDHRDRDHERDHERDRNSERERNAWRNDPRSSAFRDPSPTVPAPTVEQRDPAYSGG
jgi:hypothetical protein